MPQAGAARGRYRDAHPECSEITSAFRRLWKALDAGVAGRPRERQIALVKLVRSTALSHLCSTSNAIKPNGSKKRPKPPEDPK